MDLTGNRKIIIAGVIFFAPYIVSNLFVFIFLAPVLYLLFTRKKRQLGLVLSIFSILASITLLPLITYDPGVYLFSIFIVMTFLGIFLSASSFFLGKFSDNPVSLIMPCVVWMVLLYVLNFRGIMSSAFDIGVLFPASAPLIWYTGSIGLTALIVLFNTAVARFIAKKDLISLVVSITIGSLFLGANIFSITRPQDINDGAAAKGIALIQGDIPGRSFLGYTDRLTDRINRYIELSRSAERDNVDLVIWPEFTLPVDVMNRFPEKMAPIIDNIKNSGMEYIIGSMLEDSVKESVKYNSALIFGKNGDLKDVYYSSTPALFNKGITARENGSKLFLEKAGITICWEEITPDIFTDYVKKGAEYFISLSSNADLDYSWFKRYASFFSRARAAENKRYLARATQSGTTQIIDPFGRVTGVIPTGRSDLLVGHIYPMKGRTFYSKYGDILVKIFILLSIVSIAIVISRGSKRGGIDRVSDMC